MICVLRGRRFKPDFILLSAENNSTFPASKKFLRTTHCQSGSTRNKTCNIHKIVRHDETGGTRHHTHNLPATCGGRNSLERTSANAVAVSSVLSWKTLSKWRTSDNAGLTSKTRYCNLFCLKNCVRVSAAQRTVRQILPYGSSFVRRTYIQQLSCQTMVKRLPFQKRITRMSWKARRSTARSAG